MRSPKGIFVLSLCLAGISGALICYCVIRLLLGQALPLWLLVVLLFLVMIALGLCLLHQYRLFRLYRRKLSHMSQHDELTGLPNWISMRQFLTRAHSGYFATLDVRGFRLYNQRYGYAMGDELLIRIARRLESLPAGLHACRFQEDVFGLLMLRPDAAQEAEALLGQILEMLAPLGGEPHVLVSFSCGVVPLQPQVPADPSVLLDRANFARRQAKQAPHTKIVFYDDAAQRRQMEGRALLQDLSASAMEDEFFIAYQPKYALQTGRLVGAEALVRWQHARRGLLMPEDFIPLFEENDSIRQIDRYVLQKVLAQLAAWRAEGIPLVPVSVNLSRTQLQNPQMAQWLLEAVRAYDISPAYVDIELTEGALVESHEQMLATLRQLKNAGFPISVDDFGTGFSSLSLLHQMPIDTVKLDMSFLDGIEADPRQLVLVQDIVRMVHHMGAATLIEGVEREGQAQRMRKTGCDYVQGYLFSRPLPPEEYAGLLVRGDSGRP